jgi:hypothetical protein
MTQHWSRRSDAARRAFCDIYIRGSLSDGEPRLNLLSKGGGGAVVAMLLPQQKVRVTSGLGLPRGRIGVPLTATAWADPSKRNLHMYLQPGWLASTLQGLRLLLVAVPVAKWREFAAFDEYLSLRKQSLQQVRSTVHRTASCRCTPETFSFLLCQWCDWMRCRRYSDHRLLTAPRPQGLSLHWQTRQNSAMMAHAGARALHPHSSARDTARSPGQGLWLTAAAPRAGAC